jgi:large subunit ribosomal protein L41
MKPTPTLNKALSRLALTTKQGPHNFYKGNRTGAMGRHTKYGGYRLDYSKVRTYVCPDLTNFNVRPTMSTLRFKWRRLQGMDI